MINKTNMKKLLCIAALALLVSCSSNSDKKNGNGGNANDAAAGFNLNTMITKTVLDSVPFSAIPYTDSINTATNRPLRRIHISSTNIEFLKIKKLREFRDFPDEIPDSLITLVCRLDLNPNFYSLIINCNNMSETMNYLINYDRSFHVIDYIETCYEQLADIQTRLISTIDTSGLTIYRRNILSSPQDDIKYRYAINDEGFFRELPDDQTALGN
jgi:hypothetical protein